MSATSRAASLTTAILQSSASAGPGYRVLPDVPRKLPAELKTHRGIASLALILAVGSIFVGLALSVPPGLPLVPLDELERTPAGASVASSGFLMHWDGSMLVGSGYLGVFVGLDAPDVPIPRNTPIRLLLHFVKFEADLPWWQTGATVRLLDVQVRLNGTLLQGVKVEAVPSETTLSFALAPIDTSQSGAHRLEVRVSFEPISLWVFGTVGLGEKVLVLNHVLETLPEST